MRTVAIEKESIDTETQMHEMDGRLTVAELFYVRSERSSYARQEIGPYVANRAKLRERNCGFNCVTCYNFH